MNILLIGGGGREHSVAKSRSKSSKNTELHSIPGNAGIEKIANVIITTYQSTRNFRFL